MNLNSDVNNAKEKTDYVDKCKHNPGADTRGYRETVAMENFTFWSQQMYWPVPRNNVRLMKIVFHQTIRRAKLKMIKRKEIFYIWRNAEKKFIRRLMAVGTFFFKKKLFFP